MTRYLVSRLIESVLVLLVMSAIIYGLIGLMPGDPIDLMAASNPTFTAADVERLRALYGLDTPLWQRYLNWLWSALHLDFGYSRQTQTPALTVMMPALQHTLVLAGLAFLLAVTLALTLGVIAALKQRTGIDSVINFFAFAGISVPVFWCALMLIIVFAVQLKWLPASGMYTIGAPREFWDTARYMVLPVITLTLAYTGGFTRYTRSSMVEVLRMDYIRTARAKGVPPRRMVIRHALRNALIPVVTVMALSFGTLLSGALITETMFAQRGLGKLIYDSILNNDYNMALMCLLFATAVTLLCNLVADLCYAWLDPRISIR
ncbi:MAG: ABC transporter permease [Alphaproteobacteria bacterium]|nr:MAG: ABC transporter permease [Alphaproteobacteria bacterium]